MERYVLLLGVGALCLMILWPIRRWTFRSNVKRLVRDYVEADPPATLAEMHRDLIESTVVVYEEPEGP